MKNIKKFNTLTEKKSETPKQINTDCREEIGITVGLIDSLISIARVLKPRLSNKKEITEALKDLMDDEDIDLILNYVKNNLKNL